MSEQPGAAPAAPKKTNVFTNKIGPLPMWGWLGIVAAGLVAWRLYSSKNAAASAASTQGQAGTTTNPSTPADQVPQFVNQTYTTVTAPSAPSTAAPAAPPTRKHPVPSTPSTTPQPPSLPAPVTISGSPGSYTTGLQGGKLDEWTSTGVYSLNTIAKSHGMTAAQLIQTSLGAENNVPLQAYVAKKNYNLKIPAGVQLFFPAAKWATV